MRKSFESVEQFEDVALNEDTNKTQNLELWLMLLILHNCLCFMHYEFHKAMQHK